MPSMPTPLWLLLAAQPKLVTQVRQVICSCTGAARLMRLGALRHVYDDRPFCDDRTPYRPA